MQSSAKKTFVEIYKSTGIFKTSVETLFELNAYENTT